MTKEVSRDKISYTNNNSRFGRYDSFTISQLQEAVDEFAAQFSLDAKDVEMEFYYHADDYFGDESYLTFKGWRWETDEEFEARKGKVLAKRAKDAANARKSKAAAKLVQERKDLEEYERLKAKFNGA